MRVLVSLLTFLLFVGQAGFSAPLRAPEGAPLLTISGEIANYNVGQTAVLDRDMINNLTQTSIVTSTIWTDGISEYRGVLLKDLLDYVGAEGHEIKASAINDYAITIPLSDATDPGPIIAILVDGKQISVREKGPLWVIYPYDLDKKFRTEVRYSRSIWQLDRIEVLE